MSLSFAVKPVEQLIAIGATGLAIRKAGGGDPTKTIAAANTALEVAGVFQTASTGDAATALAQIEALIVSPTMDPTVVLELQGLLSIGEQFAQLQAAAIVAIPVIGATSQAILSNIATGITTVANAYIAQATAQQNATPAAPKS